MVGCFVVCQLTWLQSWITVITTRGAEATGLHQFVSGLCISPPYSKWLVGDAAGQKNVRDHDPLSSK